MAKYEPLLNYLSELQRSKHAVTLSFQTIEKIIADQLPRSAFEHREWWSNQADITNRPQAGAWTKAGFRVDSVSQDGADPWVCFKRGCVR